MRLVDLDPQFLRHEERIEPYQRVRPGIDPLKGNWVDEDFETVTGPRDYYVPVDTLAEAHGIRFDCPKCRGQCGGVMVGFEGKAPPGRFSISSDGADSRWQIVSGTGYDDLTLSPSIWNDKQGAGIPGRCSWHGHVTGGYITNA